MIELRGTSRDLAPLAVRSRLAPVPGPARESIHAPELRLVPIPAGAFATGSPDTRKDALPMRDARAPGEAPQTDVGCGRGAARRRPPGEEGGSVGRRQAVHVPHAVDDLGAVMASSRGARLRPAGMHTEVRSRRLGVPRIHRRGRDDR